MTNTNRSQSILEANKHFVFDVQVNLYSYFKINKVHLKHSFSKNFLIDELPVTYNHIIRRMKTQSLFTDLLTNVSLIELLSILQAQPRGQLQNEGMHKAYPRRPPTYQNINQSFGQKNKKIEFRLTSQHYFWAKL